MINLYLILFIFKNNILGCYSIVSDKEINDIKLNLIEYITNEYELEPLKILAATIQGRDYFQLPINYPYDLQNTLKYAEVIEIRNDVLGGCEVTGGDFSVVNKIIKEVRKLGLSINDQADYTQLMIAQYIVDMYGIGATMVIGSSFRNAEWNKYYDELTIFHDYSLYKKIKTLHKSKLITLNKALYGNLDYIKNRF